jgi:Mce-associated membrane protein
VSDNEIENVKLEKVAGSELDKAGGPELDKAAGPEPDIRPDQDTKEVKSPAAKRFTILRRPGKPATIAYRAAATLLLAAALASTVFFYLQNKNNRAIVSAHEDARLAACRYAPVLADYDAKNLDKYFAGVLDGATGDWKKQFDSTSRELREVLTQGEVVSKVNDVQCAIKSGDANSAEAIVVIGQTITSMGTQGKPAPGQLSMVMRLEKVDGRWLVNKVNSPLATPPRS